MSTQESEAGHQMLLDEEEEDKFMLDDDGEDDDVEQHKSDKLESSGKRQKEFDIWEGFYILNQVGTSGNSSKCSACKTIFANSGNKGISLLDTDSDVEPNAGPDLNHARILLIVFIISAAQSLSLVEGYYFQRFLRALNPLLPMRRSVIDRDVMNLYERERQTLHSIISEASGALSFAVEKWKAKETGDNYNDDIYLCVTACFVDAHSKLQRRIVGFKLLEFPEDAMYVADTFSSCFNELKLEKKVMSITLDSVLYEGSVVDLLKNILHDKGKLICNGELYHVYCCTDILNSVVRAGQELIADIIVKIRQGIHYIKYSANTKNAFYQYAKDIYQLDDTMKLCDDFFLYWDPTYKMLGCALYYKDALSHFASTDETFLSELHLSDDEWNKVTMMEKFLKPLYDITCILLKAKYNSANLYFLELYKVGRLLQVAKEHDNFMSAMVKDMKVKFDQYWSENSLMMACAAVLDPRYKLKLINYCFKKIHGETDAGQHVDRVVALLHRLLTEYKTSSCSYFVGANVTEYNANDDLFDDYPPQEQMSELDWYLASPTMDLNTEMDIMEFWNGMSKCYPDLANLARDILAIPVSTVTTKSAFTVGDKVVNPRRSTLTPELLEMLTCLHDWMSPKDRNGIALSAIEEYYSDEEDEEDMEEFYKDLKDESIEDSDNGDSSDNDGDD